MLIALLERLIRNDEYKIFVEYFKDKRQEVIEDLVKRSGDLQENELAKANGKLELLEQLENWYDMVKREENLKSMKANPGNGFKNIKSRLFSLSKN